MNIFTLYLIKSALALAILYTAYRLLFYNQTWFYVRRAVLLFITVFALLGVIVSPVILSQLSFFTGTTNQTVANTLATINLEEVIISPSALLGQHHSLTHILLVLYLLGCIFFFFRLLYNLSKIYNLYSHAEKVHHQDKITLVLLKEKIAVFSFFNLVFINGEVYKTSSQTKDIIEHEKVHIAQWHSLDIILTELVIILQWFNPFAYLLRKAIVENHEFLADSKVIAGSNNMRSYRLLLLNNTVAGSACYLANNFSNLLIKKRFKMMEKSKSKVRLTVSLLSFITAITLVMFSCTNNRTEPAASKQKTAQTESKTATTHPEQMPNQIKVPTVMSKDSVFKVVEVMPEFPQGRSGLMKYMKENIKYPEQAKNKSIEGRVFVNFVVEKDGSITHVKVLRGIGGGCDEEAVRATKSMPKWIPGKQKGVPVRVSFNIPIKFALN